MKKLKVILTFLIIISVISCTSKKANYEDSSLPKISEGSNLIIGKVTVVGNEPFTELGLMVDDTTIFILDCNKEMKETLLKNQGQNYKIFVKEKVESVTNNKFTLITAEKINK